MCRLLGVRANREVDLAFSLATGPTPFKEFGSWNPDGWGMGWYEDEEPRLFKEPADASKSHQIGRMAANEVSKVFVCHVRKATTGKCSEANCHPFAFEKWLFAHNGSLAPDQFADLRRKLDDRHRSAILGETDSEVFFHWLLQSIEDCGGDVSRGLRQAVLSIHDYTGLNFILTNGDQLYAYRDAAKNRSYYSLYYLERDPGQPDLEALGSTEVGTMIHSKGLRGEKAVLVCSERLTEENWQSIPLGHLLVVSGATDCSLIQIKPQ